jgi:phosphatidylserine/phosphatidylglycerophosphate/cardiolipin synthase-like enzyme
MRARIAAVFVFLYFLAGLTPARVPAEMLVQVCFSPAGQCSSHILDALDGANKEILVAMYAFTSEELAGALLRARERGVDVRVIVDAEFDNKSHNSVASLLANHGIPIAKVSGVDRRTQAAGLMHQKFLVVDDATVASGSYNWTRSADELNDESLLIFRNARALANEFRAEFVRLWSHKHR